MVHQILIIKFFFVRDIFNVKSLRINQIFLFVLLFRNFTVNKHLVIHLIFSLVLHLFSHLCNSFLLRVNREITILSIIRFFLFFFLTHFFTRIIVVTLLSNFIKAFSSNFIPELLTKMQVLVIAIDSTACNDTHLLSQIRFSFQHTFFLLHSLFLALNSVQSCLELLI